MPIEFSKFLQPIRVFLSYSTRDRNVAQSIKDQLTSFQFDVFLAHQDLRPSVDWQNTILLNVKTCDVFVPLLTPHFRESLWTDQEFGVALAHKKHILPVILTQNPYGFLSHIQALNASKLPPETIALEIVKALIHNPRFKERLKPGVLRSWFFAHKSRPDAIAMSPLLLALSPFTYRDMNRILDWASADGDAPPIMRIIDQIIIRQKHCFNINKLAWFVAVTNHVLSSSSLHREVRLVRL